MRDKSKLKPTVKQQTQRRISVQEICYDHPWIGNVNGYRIELEADEDGIQLFVNGASGHRWSVYQQTIKNLQLRNGGYCPFDKQWNYYAIGHDNLRYRHLFILPIAKNNIRVGTKQEIGLRYRFNCLSKKQRRKWQEAFHLTMSNAKKRGRNIHA
jgi:hypothetical protein